MNDESLDDLLALYRRNAREAPSTDVDERILREASRQRSTHVTWIWTAAALVAGVLLGIVGYVLRVAPPVSAPMTTVAAGYQDGRIAAYLLHMDMRAPNSPIAQYLLTDPARMSLAAER